MYKELTKLYSRTWNVLKEVPVVEKSFVNEVGHNKVLPLDPQSQSNYKIT